LGKRIFNFYFEEELGNVLELHGFKVDLFARELFLINWGGDAM
jgi:hypothetical protein